MAVDVRGTRGIAAFSEDRRYRYTLFRTWDEAGPQIAWVQLNPSTADADQDDPTIRRDIAFSKAWGYGSLVILNLFGLRATDPRALYDSEDPIGPENDAFLRLVRATNVPVVCAWGVHGAYMDRGAAVAKLLSAGGVDLRCLGLTQAGHPKHPLYLASATPLERFEVAA